MNGKARAVGKVLAVASLAALLGTGPAAAGSVANRGEIFTEFTPTSIVTVLEEIGVTTQIVVEDSGPFVAAVAPTGRPFVVFFTVCGYEGRQGCLGIDLLSLVDVSPATVPLSVVNDFNTHYGFAKAFRFDNTTAALSRYIVADDGIAKGNIVSNVLNFVQLIQIYEQALSQPVASLEDGSGTAQAVSADHIEASHAKAVELLKNGEFPNAKINKLNP